LRIERTGDEVYVHSPEGEALAYLRSLPRPTKALGRTRRWAERKPSGYWRVSLSALAHLKAAA
jgi:hypothetical protein